MKCHIFIFISCLLLISISGRAIDCRINLFHPHVLNSVLLTCTSGSYSFTDDQDIDYTLSQQEELFLTAENGFLWIRDENGDWYSFSSAAFKAANDDAILRIKPVLPVMEGREYYGHLEVNMVFNSLQLINVIDLERYLMGVVETEVGPAAPLELYKVQTIIGRTYAIRNIEKHKYEGYHLCDDTHCQTYKGRNRWSEDLEIAVEVSNGMILIDKDSIPIMAVFHSNSGGETQAADKIWLVNLPYLKPVLDPFSMGMPHAKWTKKIPVTEWIQYLQEKDFQIEDDTDPELLTASQVHRKKYYYAENDSIQYSKIREDWDLYSGFFSIQYSDGYFILDGKGYGHGVGLSQEGAINMARKGYHYTQILQYYFDNIQIINYLFIPGLVDSYSESCERIPRSLLRG
ncbi:MAG: SpoIID/LytB domain-containing protein [Bacteroidales bacterium]|nr:SpoIID/LytB domain-containing protein [Bacteroidales bacterium]